MNTPNIYQRHNELIEKYKVLEKRLQLAYEHQPYLKGMLDFKEKERACSDTSGNSGFAANQSAIDSRERNS